jgi:hypothetical protein
MAQAGEMATHGEMGFGPVRPKLPHQFCESKYVELKDQGETNKHRFDALDGVQDLLGGVFEIENFNWIAARTLRGGKIPEAEVSLPLEADQDDRPGGAARARKRVLKVGVYGQNVGHKVLGPQTYFWLPMIPAILL